MAAPIAAPMPHSSLRRTIESSGPGAETSSSCMFRLRLLTSKRQRHRHGGTKAIVRAMVLTEHLSREDVGQAPLPCADRLAKSNNVRLSVRPSLGFDK